MMTKRIWALAFITLHAFQLFYPSVSWADSGTADAGGPLPHEQLVDLSTGDFSYSIPLFELEGYPVTLNYKAGIQLEQQASWVGLGWSLSPGGISRQVRGIPDDFRGDLIGSSYNQNENKTYGGEQAIGAEVMGSGDIPFRYGKITLSGGVGASFSANIMYNTYTGIGFTAGRTFSAQASALYGPKYLDIGAGPGVAASVNTSIGNQSGLTVNRNYNVSLTAKLGGLKYTHGWGESTNYNSIRGYDIETETETRSLSLAVPTGEKSGSTLQLMQGRRGNSKFTSRSVSFTPSIPTGMKSDDFSFNASFGMSVYGVYVYTRSRYFQMRNNLKDSDLINPAYGFINSQHVPENERATAVLDFNRESDREIRAEVTTLPFSYTTEDRYFLSSINGATQFKAKRGDIGNYHLSEAVSTSDGYSFGLELALAPRVGDNKIISEGRGTDGEWEHLFSNTNLAFQKQKVNSPFEPYYYTISGELNKATPYYQTFNRDRAVRIDLANGGNHTPQARLVNKKEQKTGLPDVIKGYRQPRRTVIEDITVEEAAAKAFHKQIERYGETPLNRDLHSGFSPSHLTEFKVTRPNGMREYYSTPVYNRTKEEVQFNVNGNTYDIAKGVVDYTSGDASKANSKEKSGFFHKVTTPAYAEEFLLNSVVSEDYEDRTGDGPTVDDIGNYTHFSYQREHTNFKWRTPYLQDQNKALFDPQLKTQTRDDVGSYVYGERELWYLKEMNSKHLVAEFILNDPATDARLDAHGAAGKAGGRDNNQKSRFLREIKIYSQEDKAQHGASAKPLKTIKFEYKYLLCKDTPDNINAGTGAAADMRGKLTLTEVTILDHVSLAREDKTYAFTYANNPDYQINAKDNWGYYKANQAFGTAGVNAINSSDYHNMAHLTNDEFPYRSQLETTANTDASSWSMTQLTTPEGATIDIEYESDTYAHVQDHRAARLFQVAGFLNSSGGVDNILYDNSSAPRLFMVVDLAGEGINNSGTLAEASQAFRDQYLFDGNQYVTSLLYRFNTRLENLDYEKVAGFMQIDAAKATVRQSSLQGGKYTQAIIPIKPDHGNFNPIARMMWQVSADNLTWKVIPGSEVEAISLPTDFSILSPSTVLGITEMITTVLTGMKEQAKIAKKGFYRYMADRKIGHAFQPNRSFVRLFDADGEVYGGGIRVKSLQVTDGWGPFTDSYKMQYTYRGEGVPSSGVTANEPLYGDESNSLYQNQLDQLQKTLSTYNRTKLDFVVHPMGRNVLPASQVIYSRVKTERETKVGIANTSEGYSINEFYTAKDYPLQFESTKLEKYLDVSDDGSDWNRNHREVKMTASQGHAMVMNDMHGRLKSSSVYAIDHRLVSSEVHHYKNPLTNNQLEARYPQGMNTETAGIDMSVCVDWRQHDYESDVFEEQNNTEILAIPTIPPIPVPVRIGFTYSDYTLQELKTVTVSKIVEKAAILERIEYFNNGSSSFYEPLVHEGESRMPIVSKSTNVMQESDPLVSVIYPAYWLKQYRGLGPAYPQVGRVYDETILSSDNRILDPSLQVPGTECFVEFYDATTTPHTFLSSDKYWVSYGGGGSTDPDLGTGGYVFIEEDGDLMPNPANTSRKIYVIRSGYTNTPDLEVQNIQVLESAVVPATVHDQTSINSVIASSAVEYTEDGEAIDTPYGTQSSVTTCVSVPDINLPGSPPTVISRPINPFIFGIKGSWHANKTYSYVSDRAYANTLGNTTPVNLQSDGMYTCNPFYYATGDKLARQNNRFDHWVKEEEVTRYLANAGAIEVVNKQGVYSASTFGYRGEVPLSSGMNTKRGDIFFESFEDKNTTYGPAWYKTEMRQTNAFWNNIADAHIFPTISANEGHSGANAMELTTAATNKLIGLIYTLTDDTVAYRAPMALDSHMVDLGLHRDKGDTRDLLVSFWVKRTNQQVPYTISTAVLGMEVNCVSYGNVSKYYESGIIDGWKQVKFVVDGSGLASEGAYKMLFHNPYTETLYIDDIKIEPVEGEQVASTTEQVYGRKVNDLDQANFGTEYRYNESGQVANTLRETEQGKVSISSSESRLK